MTTPNRNPYGQNLARWNIERKQHWEEMRDKSLHPERYKNGFNCPNCTGMLYDTQQVLSQFPTILRVKCQQCSFKGERYE